jgi:hypothetical protein
MSVKRDSEYHKQKLLEALEKTLGIVTPACKEVGLSRNQFYVYYNTDPDFKKSVDEIQDVTLDFAENQLLKKIREGSERSILFYMKYRGRKRGYNDSMDITSGGEAIKNITFEIINKKKNDDSDIDGFED